MRDLTDRAVFELNANPTIARGLMSPGSYQHLKNRTNLFDASFGKAVERQVALYIQQDARLGHLIQHTGIMRNAQGQFISSPDFAVVLSRGHMFIDVTTIADQARHASRYHSRGLAVEIISYTRPRGIKF
jgi:hypothetical protein